MTGFCVCESEPIINYKLRVLHFFFVADNIRDVTLQKSLGGLGFSFLVSELGTDEGSVVHIKSLSPGQPAGDCGLLKVGDIILAINGESVRGLSYEVKDASFIQHSKLLQMHWDSDYIYICIMYNKSVALYIFLSDSWQHNVFVWPRYKISF